MSSCERQQLILGKHQATRNSYNESDSRKIRQGLLQTEFAVDYFGSSCNHH